MNHMGAYAKVKRITLPVETATSDGIHQKLRPPGKRIICISDVHGELDLFKRLLEKVEYIADDILILPGDLYTKGTQCHETLKFLIALDQNPNVHMLRGNCDWVEDYLSPQEARWLEDLPDIIDAGTYIFVHSGLASLDLAAHRPAIDVKYNNFLENAPAN
jgi:predicted MPP superfamily phosphohydrolase